MQRVIEERDVLDADTIRTYDSRDNQIMLQDPNQGIQYFTYDKNNQMLTSAHLRLSPFEKCVDGF